MLISPGTVVVIPRGREGHQKTRNGDGHAKWKEIAAMNTILREIEVQRTVHLSLEETAIRLSSHDLLKIAEVASHARGEVRIRPGSWQVLVSAPESHYRRLENELSAIGYRNANCIGKINERSTFLVGGVMNEAPL
jgi:hypothetical protein